jgi:flagellar biosynthesis/type III secretory pathway protein FliH
MKSPLEVPTGARVIKAGDASHDAQSLVANLSELTNQARQIVLDARKEAARLLAEARKAADELKAQAKREAPTAQQVPPPQSVSDELASLLRTAAAELHAAREQVLSQARRQMLLFAMELARKIVGKVAAADIGAANANLDKALRLAGGGDIVVRANPRQVEELKRSCRELVGALAMQGDIRLEGDEQVSPGGVKVICRGGEIDATIQTQLANVASSLLGQAYQPLLDLPVGRAQPANVSA